MNSTYLQYLKKLLIFSAILAIIVFVIAYFLPVKYLSPALPFLLLFFVAISLLTHYFVIKSITRRMSQFVNFFMISIFVKLILYIAIIVVYALINPHDIIPFVVTFFIFYLLYTLFELIEVLKLQKNMKNNTTT